MKSFKDKPKKISNNPFPFNYRSWVPDLNIPTDSDKYVRVISYNILCDSLLSVSTQISEEDIVKTPYLQWENRKKVIIQEILALKADIICMQEFERDEALIKELGQAGYNVWNLF